MPKQWGFTLLELMIGIGVGVAVMAGVFSTYLSFLKSNNDTIKAARLDNDLRAAMALMTTDIRRAGYWANASSAVGSGVNSNPFMTSATKIQASADSTCILLSYDLDKNGSIPALGTAGGDERFGYRLRGGQIQSRPTTLSTFSCDDADSSWDAITELPVMEITDLSFSISPIVIDIDGSGPGTSTITINTVNISITGRLSDDHDVTRTLTEIVRVRNDIYTP
jgi:type II secretory pathway component PulJ